VIPKRAIIFGNVSAFAIACDPPGCVILFMFCAGE